MVFVPHRLAYFTQHNALQFHPCRCKGFKLLKSKQNITRDIEIKNNVTIARGEWGGDSGERGFQELL